MIRGLVFPLLLSCTSFAGLAQDGASYDPHAKDYRAPEFSLASAKDTPERMTALGLLLHGDTGKGISALKQLAADGDAASALLLGGMYRHQSNLPIAPDPMEALRLYRLASSQGSGEGSERIAEMIEGREVQVEGDAKAWRALAVKQGWVQEQFAASCFDWTHGPQVLQCNSEGPPPASMTPSECPTEEEMALLRGRGMTGSLQINGGAGSASRNGPEARAILILDHPIPGEQDLKQPMASSVIYIQTPEDRWQMLPPTAPMTNLYLILSPKAGGRGRTSIGAQNPDGSIGGSICSRFTN
jgi:hypothetical protein